MTTNTSYNGCYLSNFSSLDIENSLVEKYNTSNISDLNISFFRVLPSNINIFKNAQGKTKIASDESLNRLIIIFLLKFQELLFFINKSGEITNNLSPLLFNSLEDGMILIEWIFKDFRIGFDFEKDKSEINWYLVANKNVEEYTSSGTITIDDSEQLLKQLIFYVLSNT